MPRLVSPCGEKRSGAFEPGRVGHEDPVERVDAAGPIATEAHVDVDGLEESLTSGNRFGTGGRIAVRLGMPRLVQPLDPRGVENPTGFEEAAGATSLPFPTAAVFGRAFRVSSKSVRVTRMRKHFALDMPAGRFARNTLVASVLGLLPLLVLYIALTPGFTAQLAGGGPALWRFLRQVLTNGLPVVFAVNYVGFFLFAWAVDARPDGGRQALVLLIDLPLRVLLFIILHAVIYVVSADWFGSFGGSRLTALLTVAPTLARSALFENISGVYLYATLASAVPLYAATIAGTDRFEGSPFRFPGRAGAILAALALFCLFAVLLTATAKLIVRFQSG